MNRHSNRAASPYLWIALAFLPAVGEAGSASREQLLDAARSTLVSGIEPGLPDVPVATWLSSVVGSIPSWGLNDCGEQTGAPDTDPLRDLPICAELEAVLSPRRSVYLYFLVGTQAKGVVESRFLYFASLIDGEKFLPFSDLSALAAYFEQSQSHR